MAQALVPASPIPVVQHPYSVSGYRVDSLHTSSRPQRHSNPSRKTRRSSLNSYHLVRPQHDYLNTLLGNQRQQERRNTGYKQDRNLEFPQTLPTSLASPRSCVHSFTKQNNYKNINDMSIVESVHNEALPNSPPDLTESKSSKSSGSFRSSCLTDTTGPENLSHFEEIALADSERNSVEVPSAHHVGKKALGGVPSTRQHKAPSVYTRKSGMQSVDALRDTTNMNNTIRPSYPSLKGQVSGVLDQQRRTMPNGRPMRRDFTSPSAVSVGATMSARDVSSSRSVSPNDRTSSNGSRSPRLSVGNSFANNHRNFNRKSSAQPRKTIKELEAEYHDSDEDVPDDAVIWNVPISPRPPLGPSNPPSPKRSFSQARLTADLPSKHASDQTLDPVNAPNSPPRPNMPHSATLAAFPRDSLASTGRTKSWAHELSNEARELTAALEAHAEEEREKVTPSSSPPRPSLNNKLRTKSSIMELPPIQTGNIMIDPLPISKEKEAVLTRTRPSWLPPKSQKEEKKHIKEWERMMAKAAEAEKRREQKQLQEEKGKEELNHNLAKIWDQHVLPNWDVVVHEPRTRELWWRGITPKSRGIVWAKAIGNELSLSEASYTAALSRAKALQAFIAQLSSEEQQKHKDAAWLAAIARDIPTVLPESGIFGKDSPLHQALENVLLAYSAYRSDVGYVYGTHTLAGLLVLNLPPSDAFVTLANMLNRPMALGFLVNDQAAIRRAQEMVLATLKYKIPKLHEHLLDDKTGVSMAEWLDPFLMTMGTMHLSPEACSRLWDVSVFEGDKSYVRAAVGVLSLLESKLYGDQDEIISILGWGAAKWTFGEDEFMVAVREAGKVSHADRHKSV